MLDANSVITTATKGIVEDLAREMEVGLGRMYEILGKDCPHPKDKRLIRKIAHCDKSPDKWRVRLIKADNDAMFAQILGDVGGSEVCPATLHSELSDAIHAKLAGLPKAERLRECREAKATLDKEIEFLEKEEIASDYGLNGNSAQTAAR